MRRTKRFPVLKGDYAQACLSLFPIIFKIVQENNKISAFNAIKILSLFHHLVFNNLLNVSEQLLRNNLVSELEKSWVRRYIHFLYIEIVLGGTGWCSSALPRRVLSPTNDKHEHYHLGSAVGFKIQCHETMAVLKLTGILENNFSSFEDWCQMCCLWLTNLSLH